MKSPSTIPAIQDFRRLSRLVAGYPVSRDELIWTAQAAKLGQPMITFLEQFPEGRNFRNPEDFTNTAKELEILTKR